MRKRLMAALMICVTTGGVLFIWLLDPSQVSFLPPCPFRAVAGLFCPGCGTARALHSLVHGDLVQALAFNPYAVLAVPAIGYWGIQHVAGLLAGRTFGRMSFRPASLWLFVAVLLVFSVVRNVPHPGLDFIRPHVLAASPPPGQGVVADIPKEP